MLQLASSVPVFNRPRGDHAFVGQPIPLIGPLVGAANHSATGIPPEFNNQLGAMHGTIMVFLGMVYSLFALGFLSFVVGPVKTTA